MREVLFRGGLAALLTVGAIGAAEAQSPEDGPTLGPPRLADREWVDSVFRRAVSPALRSRVNPAFFRQPQRPFGVVYPDRDFAELESGEDVEK